MTVVRILSTAVLSVLAVSAADARPRVHAVKDKPIICTRFGCNSAQSSAHTRSARIRSARSLRHQRVRRSPVRGLPVRAATAVPTYGETAVASYGARHSAGREAVVLGHRPSGCPHRYCGFGVSLKVFGKIIPSLNLAWNWVRTFPREGTPRAGLVAARSGHVMLLLRHVEGRDWLVFDPNSGGGLTREHVRSVAGYVFVNPHASLNASLALK